MLSSSPMSSSVEPGSSGFDIAHHVFDPGVILESVHREILAVPGMLVAPVRHLRHERDVRIDPHATEVERAGHTHRAAVVARPDTRREAVLDTVGPFERLGLVVETLHGDDRAEDLALDEIVVLTQAGDDGRLVEISACADTMAARNNLGVR